MEEKEIWKDIEGFEGKYQISNMGNVKSLNYNNTGKERILKPWKNRGGYLQVVIFKDGKAKGYLVHQLVATAFCENPEGYTEINHKDEDKTNNNVDNLEWCDRKYNVNYGTRNKRAGKKQRGKKIPEEQIKKLSKPIYSINKKSGLIMYWESAMKAERCTGIANGNINKCLKGKRKSAGGFYWMYADADAE